MKHAQIDHDKKERKGRVQERDYRESRSCRSIKQDQGLQVVQ